MSVISDELQDKKKIVLEDFSLVNQSKKLERHEIKSHMDGLKEYFRDQKSHFAGYQVNADFDYSALSDFLEFHINNVGDPFVAGTYGIHSRMMERPIIEFFAKLFHAKEKDYWGYVTSGGTEANMYGLYTGRVFLESESTSSVSPKPIAYFSEETHYSIRKALRMLAIDSEIISSTPKGSIKVSKLMDAILQSDIDANPPLIVVTMGTSFKCAYDDLEEIVKQLRQHHIEKFYIHVDAALSGLFLPFLEVSQENDHDAKLSTNKIPIFDFRLPIGSIAVSGHKFIGTPFPCAIFMTLKGNMRHEWEKIDYVGSLDSTMSGSRNGLAPIFLWYAIATKGFSGLTKYALKMLETADYAVQRITDAGLNVWKNDLGLSVIFDRPPEWIVRKWSLATVGNMSHIFTMGHVTHEMIDELTQDLQQARQTGLRKEQLPSHHVPALTMDATNIPSVNFNCRTDYALEHVNSIDLKKLEPFFEDMPADAYLEGGYRFRRFSHIEVVGDRIHRLPHGYLFQSQDYNPLLGDVVRDYPECDQALIDLPDFQKLIFEFFEFARLCTTSNKIGVHQIRTIARMDHVGHPAPEGRHQDGVDTIGIFCLRRHNIEGAETSLFKSKDSEQPVMTKILNPGELLVVSDRQYFHYTSPTRALSTENGIRDVFVLTCPDLVTTELPKR
ncbi:Histidine decarboxylase [[Leptolyngbya] sp. PCC 7376]|uniref:histidine decarboxylase n=1 Tax=[Leptolyngbya] sp. PCC 7376 TaxID=111781 RepID=UPI00029EE383|nr:histidine decarboxylase [[Leptolyngbya] sp. PCC 7376]AFY36874.1 Histidine decarboxylase [[Leptolyngbya] sp. PCC 7376]